jgi:hypothetical protein
MSENYNENYNENNTTGKNNSTASMVLGIISVVCWFFGYSAILSIILGIIGLVLAINTKKAGYDNGMRKAGFVLSIIGIVGGALVFIACFAILGIGTYGIISDPELNDMIINSVNV